MPREAGHTTPSLERAVAVSGRRPEASRRLLAPTPNAGGGRGR